MEKKIKDASDHTVSQLFYPCRACVYWEAPEVFDSKKCGKLEMKEDEAVEIKKAWFRKTLDGFGPCGKTLYVENKVVGYCQYAPSQLLPRALDYSQRLFQPNQEAILISCLYVQEGYQQQGLGTLLLKAVLNDLEGRGYSVVETYARDDSSNNCSGPTQFYLKNGFTVVKAGNWEETDLSLMSLKLGKYT